MIMKMHKNNSRVLKISIKQILRSEWIVASLPAAPAYHFPVTPFPLPQVAAVLTSVLMSLPVFFFSSFTL